MRLPLAALVLLALNYAFAQEPQLISAPKPNFQARLRIRQIVPFEKSAAPSTFKRSWYWEVTETGPSSAQTSRYLPRGANTDNSDFAPASLQWSFTGKRKFIPTLDLTVVQIRPGAKSSPVLPAANYGTIEQTRAKFWTKAGRSISGLLH